LNNNGIVTVSRDIYYKLSSGKSVYVVLAKGILDVKYHTGQIYLTSQYKYVDK
jgi:hypothetical protein